MKVILLKDVKGKGKKDDIITVSDGYGNNYLLKNKLGVIYTSGSKKILDKEISERCEKEEKLVSSLNKIKDALEDKTFKFKVKVGANDKVFGNISTKQIVEKLKENGYDIDKKCLSIDGNIDTLGVHKVLITLHKKVKFNIFLEVIK